MGKVKVCGCQLHWDHHFAPLKCLHTEMSSLILCTRDRGLSLPPQLRVHTRWLQLPSKRGNGSATALGLGPLCFLSPLLSLQKPLVLYHVVLPCGDVSLLSMVSSQHQSEIGVRRLSGHPPSSLPMCYYPSTTKPGRQQSLAGQWALDSGLHLDIPFPFKVSDGFPTKGDSTKGSPQ